MNANAITRKWAVAILLAATGCATSHSASRGLQTTNPETGNRRTASSEGAQRGPSAHALRAFNDAVAAFRQAARSAKPDWTDADRQLKEVIAIDDRFGEAYFDLGLIYQRENKLDEAKQMYETALAKKPSLHQAEENLAVMQENEGHRDRAIQMYQEMTRKFPQDGGSRARLAALYQAAGQDDEALKLAREALMRDPKNLTAYKVMMRVYLARKNFNLAELVALRAEKLDAHDPELYYTVGQIALQQGDEIRATSEFRKALKARQNFLPARAALASIAVKHHDWAQAAMQYGKLAQYEPKSSPVHLDLGIALHALGHVDQAFAQYEQAQKLDPNNAQVYYALGVVFQVNKSLPDKALQAYKTFVEKAGPLPANHPVYTSIKNCEELVAINQKMAEQQQMMKQQQEAQKKLAAQKAQEQAQQKAAAANKKSIAAASPAGAKSTKSSKPAAAPQKTAQRQPSPPAASKDTPPSSDEPSDPGQ